jgi:hypothetical protein
MNTNIGANEYRIKKIKNMDKFEIQGVAEKLIDYQEKNKHILLFKTTKQVCMDLNLSHYKFKFYLEIYRKYLKSKGIKI